jgi:hypothetical protein
MRTKIMWRLATVGVAALAAGIGWISVNPAAEPAGNPLTPPASDAAAKIVRLKAEIEQLKGRIPDQSHVMKDVGVPFLQSLVCGATAELAPGDILSDRNEVPFEMGRAHHSRAQDPGG